MCLYVYEGKGCGMSRTARASSDVPSWDPAAQEGEDYFETGFQYAYEEEAPAPSPKQLLINDPAYALRKVFGLEAFRGRQLEVVQSAMRGEDEFVIMPTGGGKSICFQVRAPPYSLAFVKAVWHDHALDAFGLFATNA